MNTPTRYRLALALAAAVALVGLSTGCGKESSEAPKPSAALNPPPLPPTGFKAEITVLQPPARLKVNESVVLDVTVKNLGDATWPHEGGSVTANGVNLSYHWLERGATLPLADGIRTNLPSDLSPGAAVALRATVKAPVKPGAYILEFDMVQEKVDWFKNRGSKPVRFDVTIE
jgi:hypothetical protein